MFTIQKAIHTIKGDNSKCIVFSESCPFFDLNFLSSIKHPTVEHWHPHVVLLLMYAFFMKLTLSMDHFDKSLFFNPHYFLNHTIQFHYTPAKQMFLWVYRNQPVSPFVCLFNPSVYKISVSVKALAGVLSPISDSSS